MHSNKSCQTSLLPVATSAPHLAPSSALQSPLTPGNQSPGQPLDLVPKRLCLPPHRSSTPRPCWNSLRWCLLTCRHDLRPSRASRSQLQPSQDPSPAKPWRNSKHSSRAGVQQPKKPLRPCQGTDSHFPACPPASVELRPAWSAQRTDRPSGCEESIRNKRGRPRGRGSAPLGTVDPHRSHCRIPPPPPKDYRSHVAPRGMETKVKGANHKEAAWACQEGTAPDVSAPIRRRGPRHGAMLDRPMLHTRHPGTLMDLGTHRLHPLLRKDSTRR